MRGIYLSGTHEHWGVSDALSLMQQIGAFPVDQP